MAWQNSNTETGCGKQQLGIPESVSTQMCDTTQQSRWSTHLLQPHWMLDHENSHP